MVFSKGLSPVQRIVAGMFQWILGGISRWNLTFATSGVQSFTPIAAAAEERRRLLLSAPGAQQGRPPDEDLPRSLRLDICICIRLYI